MKKSVFNNAKFTSSIFSKANMLGGEFANTDMSLVDFREATFDMKRVGMKCILDGAIMSGQDYSGLDFSAGQYVGVDFTKSKFQGAKMRASNFSNSNFSKCKMSEVDAINSTFDDCQMTKVDLKKSNLTHTSFIRANLQKVKLNKSNMTNSNFTDADMATEGARADIEGADISGATIPIEVFDAQICKAKGWLRYGKFPKVNWQDEDLSQTDCEEINLSGAVLEGSIFTKSSLRLADLSNANLERCKFIGCDMTRCDLRGAQLRMANFDGADLTNADYDVTSESLSLGWMMGAIVGSVNWARKDIQGAKLNGAILDGANLSYSILTDCEMEGVSFKEAKFYGATYDPVDFAKKGWLKYGKVSHLDAAADWRGKKLKDADLRGCVLTGANLSDCDLTECNFDGANLTQCNLRGANLTNCTMRGTILTRADFSGCKIKGIKYGHHPGDFNMWYISSHALIIDPHDEQALEDMEEKRIDIMSVKKEKRAKGNKPLPYSECPTLTLTQTLNTPLFV